MGMALVAAPADAGGCIVGGVPGSGAALTQRILAGLDSGQHAQAVLFDSTVDAGQRAEALLELLVQLCCRDPEAQCILLCERRQLHTAAFGQRARVSPLLLQAEAEAALRRIHIKYVRRAVQDCLLLRPAGSS